MPEGSQLTGNFLVTEPRAFFEEIDKNHDGVIDMSELKLALQRLHIPVSQRLMTKIQSSCDSNHNDGLRKRSWRDTSRLR